MSDRTHFTLSILDKQLPKLMLLLDEKHKETMADLDDSRIEQISNAFYVKHFYFFDRAGYEYEPLLMFIAKQGIPATLNIGGIDGYDPKNIHARINSSGEMKVTRIHPSKEGLIEYEKVMQAYMLGQIDMLIKDMENSNFTWQRQMAVLQGLGKL